MYGVNHLERGINSEVETTRDKAGLSFWRRLLVILALLAIAFLAGLIPQWLSAREMSKQLNAAQGNLRLSQLQNRLGSAAINARRGEYEPARIAASDFFTDLRAELERRETTFNANQREAMEPLLNERDEIITQLARYDAGAGDNLANLYLSYARAVNPSALKQN